MIDQKTATWRDRAVSAHRIQGLATRVRDLIGVDVDPEAIETLPEGSRVTIDDVTFVLNTASGSPEVIAPCPRCHRPKTAVPVETLCDVGRAVDSLCRDCDFLVRSGVPAPVAEPAGSRR